ncbi:MAG: SDR family NAD(P)-dependent oxidoreductase [Candidatus Aminicenantes bacterium]|nr:SDR family NAD(P)-dependent oxidoreductase [Candidatus Aminicenantes bacterium]NIM85068.1 SDR family NAD(P)-dependent oxidoreductase [Candidatus Aminicenantes bacterium]NIN24575.1 SDR family NAD(P)-dependent oxidoreductase [Candidatus Aminicenantes bacterium]NIN48339.1 SDR family NAD(P)-dependent oxidoreductase [Candidatus Aminicenantes bacterium]NIN91242.1 SDR family NAD(P)-dependent oxidoreductase [Candidatus Aminicenantes bacterium]
MVVESISGSAPQDPEPEASGTGLEVAVIGMACRFPGAKNIDEFWDNLKNGVESIISFSHQELVEAGVDRHLPENPNYVNARGHLEDSEYFDAAFFGYTPLEAHMMHPQIRLFHECTWEVLENAGYNPDDYNGLIGLFAGLTPSLIWDIGNSIKEDSGSERFATHNLNSNFFCTIVSYKLNLKGPAVTVQTACSTSLVAIHTACRSLLTGECDMALAGGVTIALPRKMGYVYQEGMIMSPDGHCRAFDAKARGTVGGDGVGLVALKLLGDAREDGDHIYAVIKGSAINNDGNRKVGYTAPSVEGQKEVIKSVFQMSELDPETVTYVETHGTGTVLGDPIEIEALKLAFNTNKKGYCRIGSVKTNVGHLDSAAGVAGFIKAVLALTHKQIPPSLYFEAPNPKIDFENSPFVVNTELTEWKCDGFPRRAGVSSFGIGGTNAHAILEEWPERARGRGQGARRSRLILVSARSAEALDRAANNLADHFQEHPDINFADAAYTLQVGRKAFEHRRMLVCSTIDEAAQLLRAEGESRFNKKGDKHIVFLFPGQGAQYVDMGRELYQTEPVFRETMDQCFEILTPTIGYNIKEIIYPNDPSVSSVSSVAKNKLPDIDQTEITQPVIFAIEYALAKLLISWGITPFAMIGHSIGEYTAACLAEVFSLEDALNTVALRGKLMQQMPSGSMISVPLSKKELKPILASNLELSLAAVNGPASCVLSGSHEAVEAAVRQLKEKGVESKHLHTSHAFHSQMMDPVLKAFEQHLSNIPLHKPQIPFISNFTGTWITFEDAVNPVYWARHLRETVRFFDGLTELMKDKASIFVEVGPGRVLTVYATQHPDRTPDQLAVNLVRHPKENVSDNRYLLNKIGRLWLYGGVIDGRAFHEETPRKRIPLPTYPFARQAYSADVDLYNMSGAQFPGKYPAGKKADIADWLYTPLWEQSLLPQPKADVSSQPQPDHWLIFSDPDTNQEGLEVQLVDRLKQEGYPVVKVEIGTGFRENSNETFVINLRQTGDYDSLFTRLVELKKSPRHILHLWNIARPSHTPLSLEALDQSQDMGFYSLLAIARAVGKCNIKEDIDITVVTSNVFCVIGDEELYPERATLLGALRVIPKEYPNIYCRCIDILPPHPGTREEELLVKQLMAEVFAHSPDTDNNQLAAYRGSRRWVPTIKPALSTGTDDLNQRLKEKGVYLVTGGLGGIGMTLADELARRFQARLILTGRSFFPEPEEWDRWIADHGEPDPVSRKIRKIQEWEAAGAEVMTAAADIADLQQMHGVIARVRERYGEINGVIHSAGVPDFAGVIQRRTRETTEPILAPKVKGTLVLERLITEANLKPDFLVLCSSLSSVLAPLGQVGYCAANAFLDSYAFYKMSKNGLYTVSVNWDAWQQVGMAVEAVEQLAASGSGLLAGVSGARTPLPVKPVVPEDRLVSHPLFHHWQVDEENSNTYRYVSYLSAETHWVLDEHRIMGMPTLPGTAYLEMVRATVDHHTGNSHLPIEIRNISFISPITAGDGEVKEVHTLLEERDGGYTFTIGGPSLSSAGESNLFGHVYAAGNAAVIQAKTREKSPGSLDIQTIEDACHKMELQVKNEGDSLIGAGLVTPGPRWNNTKQIKYGEHQAMARLELPGEFAADLRDFRLHPAVLDTATSILVGAAEGENTYLPFSYQRAAIYQPLPGKVVVYARDKSPEKSGSNTLSFDVTLVDNQGAVLVEIEAYTLMKVTKEKQAAVQTQPGLRDAQGKEFLKDAITPAEGVEVFHRILSIDFPQVLVSTVDFAQRLRQDRELSTASIQEKAAAPGRLIPASPRPELSTPYAAPETQNQQILADIWQEILGIEGVGIRDDFFELGGDSLKAITITARIQKELQVEVPLAEFFNAPTISGLAEYIEGAKESIYSSIAPVEQKEYYPLSSAQKRLFILCRMNPDSTFYNLPQILKMEGQLEVERFDRAFAALIGRHESLRTSFRMLENESIQVVQQPDEVDFQVEHYEKDVNAEEITQHFIRPFDLDRAPLLRVTIIALEDNKYVWMMDIHHIAADATSLAILEKDLFRLYNDQELTPLRLQYKDFSTWQNNLVESSAIQEHEEYWLNLYSDTPQIPELQLPYDFERPVIRQFKGDRFNTALEAEDAKKFMDLAASIRGTFFMNVLAALNVLFSKYSGRPDIIIGTSIAGRPHADLQDILGMFVNMLAVRNFPDENLTYMEFLQKVKTNVLDAFAHQDMQFEKLVDKLGLGKTSARNPLFEVALNVQNYEQAAIPANDLKILPHEMEFKTAKFDLLLWANDMGAGTAADANKGIFFSFEYSTEMFKRSTVEVIANHLLEVIKQVAENRDIKLKDIKLSHQLVRSEASVPQVDFEF